MIDGQKAWESLASHISQGDYNDLQDLFTKIISESQSKDLVINISDIESMDTDKECIDTEELVTLLYEI